MTLEYLARRLLEVFVSALVVAVAIFIVLRLLPGDPAVMILGGYATPESIAMVRRDLGTDRPIWEQFAEYMKGLARGNLGMSYRTGRPVAKEIASVYFHTLVLSVVALFVSVVFGIMAGVAAARRRDTWVDRSVMILSTTGVSVPAFTLSIVLLMVFGVRLKWFPIIGTGTYSDASFIRHLVLPSLTLGLTGAAALSRMTRATLLDVLSEDFIRTARSKGLSENIVAYKHALRACLPPIITIIGMRFGQLLGGTVIVETVFTRPGLGKLLVDAMWQRDYIQVQGCVLILALAFLGINLVTDLFYAFSDPRIQFK